MAIRLAGFEIRDSLQWVYGSGFPKSHNISKAIDKMYGAEREVVGESPYTNMNIKGKDGFMVNDTEERIRQKITTPSTEQAKEWDGWGSALKPAVEPIVLARKPLEKGLSIAENVLKWGTGAINIDGCRVATDESWTNVAQDIRGNNGLLANKGNHPTLIKESNPQGRFPANLILTHHEDCECVGTKKVKGQIDKPTNRTQFEGTWSMDNTGLRSYTNKSKEGYGDENGEETIEDWNCVDDCPIKIMDEQSRESKSSKRGSIYNKPAENSNIYTPATSDYRDDNTYADKGGASRFFYTPKTSKSERNWGLEDFEETISSDRKAIHNVGANNPRSRSGKPKANIHPTVKPVKLMQYLARLITPPNGLVLDPFNGSGTTGIACKLEGFDYIGLEISEEYCEIARSRIESWDDELEYMMELRIKEIEREQKKDVSQLNLF
jgi:site-specific DNA-methyltransferase (adenine-specific)